MNDNVMLSYDYIANNIGDDKVTVKTPLSLQYSK